MAKNKSSADKIAAELEHQVQQKNETYQQLIKAIEATLNPPKGGPNVISKTTRQGLEEALSWAKKQVPLTNAADASTKQIAAEGQPTGPTSAFGQMFNGTQQLTTAGTMALAQVLGSKYLIGINDKVNVSEDAKGLGALAAIVKPGLSVGQVLTSLLYNQDSGTIQAIQRELVAAGYLDPMHTNNLQIGAINGAVSGGDPTLQALANMLEASNNHKQPLQQILAVGQKSRQGQDFANLWDSIVSGKPFSVSGQQTQISSPDSLAGTLRKAATGEGFGQGVLGGGAGRNPTQAESTNFAVAAQQYQMEHPTQVTTQYEPQPGLGISGFTRFPLQKSQTSVGGADQAAMDQFTYNWVLQNMGSDVAAQGAGNILSAFNQLLGLSNGTGNAPGTAAGGAS